ncbi:DUF3265 domain-containing protein [Vibrio vulnificus]|nr:DUF3265 domain-containing protein [Vibrio vulnificus]EGQ9976391.1 DUF3265 domain-containing protein [Vibrio vulnificus]EHH0795970.1 DUF3265 domain-containing protein [Vibrio vulnificus]EHH1182757.1 DUF3265 domain-containing protein [Vibrio vulnificus]EHW0638226.1 DUF3265 domain-containing protein [Vibrio vulnificus]EIA1304799.1 DUF3265 domain-containing protein [Vibrio vulnificus]
MGIVGHSCQLLANRERKISLTNASRGTANAWHFYRALVFVITVLCGKLVVALAAP